MADLPHDAARWRGLIGRIARATRKPDRAEDFLHSAFLRLEEYRARNAVANPAGFLMRAAANIAIDEDRRERVRAEVGQSICELVDLSDDQPLQHEVLIARHRLARVRAGLSELSPRTRDIFLKHRIEGLKYREIAAELDITVSAVEKHVAKAAMFLGEWVEGW